MRTFALSVSLLLLLGSSALGQSLDMKVHLKSGTTTTISSGDIRRIHFTNVTLGVTDPVTSLPSRGVLQLLRNYPNPFRPSTTIEFQLAAGADVSVRIYDLAGALVRDLLNQNVPAGRHQVSWDGTDRNHLRVPSGLYFLRVVSGGEALSSRLVLID
jgi:hypothetical protein